MASILKAEPLLTSILSWKLYKRHQGRLTRLLSSLGLGIAFAMLSWALNATLLADSSFGYRTAVPISLAAAGSWLSFRLVHYPRFADFLIDVQVEMAKVSWPGWDELRRSTLVVLTTMVTLSVLLFSYDVLWQTFLRWINVLQV